MVSETKPSNYQHKRKRSDNNNNETNIKRESEQVKHEEHLAVSHLISSLSKQSSSAIDAAADVMALYGQKSKFLDIQNSEFLNNMRQFLAQELLYDDETWFRLIQRPENLQLFCDRLQSITNLITTRKNQISDLEDFAVHVEYIARLKEYFASLLGELRTNPSREAEGADVIITNEQEDHETTPIKRKSTKAVPRLRPFGSLALPILQQPEEVDNIFESTYQEAEFQGVHSDLGSSIVISEEAETESTENDDGLQLKKSADEAMITAITSNIQRRLRTAFNPQPIAETDFAALESAPWVCPQEDCSMNLENSSTPEARDVIQKHYEAHARQYLTAMEAVRIIGAGQHVDRLLAKIDRMAEIWRGEQLRLDASLLPKEVL